MIEVPDNSAYVYARLPVTPVSVSLHLVGTIFFLQKVKLRIWDT